jgi:RNA polymerase sigma-70 factor (ECF subfamily)
MDSDQSELLVQRAELNRYVRRYVGDYALSEDIVQETYLRFFAYRAKVDKVNTVMALLRRISLNLMRDHFRRAGRVRMIELSDDIPATQPCIHEQLERRELIGIVRAVLSEMPRTRRAVFFLRRIHGYSAKEVAQMVGISPGAVDAHVARAVLNLYKAIDRLKNRG